LIVDVQLGAAGEAAQAAAQRTCDVELGCAAESTVAFARGEVMVMEGDLARVADAHEGLGCLTLGNLHDLGLRGSRLRDEHHRRQGAVVHDTGFTSLGLSLN
jgi:hypothetical protein